MALSNFYNDFAFTDKDFAAINAVYRDLITAIDRYACQIKDNITISRIETYRHLPIQRLSIKEAMYSLNSVLENINTVKKFNLSSLSLQDRIAKWNSGEISDSEKISILNFLGYYIQLSTRRGLTFEKEHNIVDLTLNQKNTELIRNYEYYLVNNKIYLMGSFANAGLTQDKDFALKNISIDYETTEELIGKSIQVSYSDALTRNEYSEIVKALTYASLGGPTLSNLKSAISSITGFSQIQIYDKYTRDANKQKIWGPNGSLLSGFEFVVALPAEYATNNEKLNIIANYLKLIKPVYSKFAIITNSYYDEYIKYTNRIQDTYIFGKINELLSEEYNTMSKVAETVYLQRINELIAENQFKNTSEAYTLDKIVISPTYDTANRYWSESHVKDAALDLSTDDLSHTNWNDALYLFKLIENITEATYNINDDNYNLDKVLMLAVDSGKRASEGVDIAATITGIESETYTKIDEELSVSTTITNVAPPSYTNGDTLLNDSFDTMYFGPTVQVVNY